MATQSYRDLLVWRKAMELATECCVLARALGPAGGRSMADQLRRAAVSVPSNIAEGAGRGSKRSYLQFVRIARGSLNEVETLLVLAQRLQYLSPASSARADALVGDVGRLLTLLMRALAR